MKACIIQPYYSFEHAKLGECFDGMMKIIDSCDDSMDLIVLPEYCDIPAATENAEQFDFGCKTAEPYAGLEIITFEDILKKFACTVIFNIHMKIWDMNSAEPQYERIAALLRQYGCEHHCYMMSTSDKCLAEFHEVAPDIERCVGWDGEKHDMRRMVDRAVKLGVKKIQLFKPFFNQDSIDYAHANGIRCNVFWADDPQEACRYIDMGIDTVLTNDYLQISNAVKQMNLTV